MHWTLVAFLTGLFRGSVSADDPGISRVVCQRTSLPRLHPAIAMAGWFCLPAMPSGQGLDPEARKVLVQAVRLSGFGDGGNFVPRYAQAAAPPNFPIARALVLSVDHTSGLFGTRVRACLEIRPVRGPGLQPRAIWAVSCRPRALTRRFGGIFKQALRK